MKRPSSLMLIVTSWCIIGSLPTVVAATELPASPSASLPAGASSDRGATIPSPLPATSSAPNKVDLARIHFRRGVAMYRAGAYDAAFAEFMRTYESAPNHRCPYNLPQG